MTFHRSFITFINQIFGDESIRNKIMELYPNNNLKIIDVIDEVNKVCEPRNHDNDNNRHIVCQDKHTQNIIDSRSVSGNKVQNNRLHPNDTLCQSYSILRYLSGCDNWFDDNNYAPVYYSQSYATQKHYELQLRIINMYKILLKNEDLCLEISCLDWCIFNDDCERIPKNGDLRPGLLEWYMLDDDCEENEYVPENKDPIANIQNTLDNWDYNYNIGGDRIHKNVFV